MQNSTMACHMPYVSPAQQAQSSRSFELYGRLYSTAQNHLRACLEKFLETLGAWGMTPGGSFFGSIDKNYFVFEGRLLALVADLQQWVVNQSPGQQGYQGIFLEGVVAGNYPRALLHEILLGLGAENDAAGRVASILTRVQFNPAAGAKAWNEQLPAAVRTDLLNIHNGGCALHARLKNRLGEVNAPFKGAAQYPQAGLNQLMELLGELPDIADTVYEAGGLKGIAGVPPKATGQVQLLQDSPESMLIIDAGVWASRNRILGYVKVAGLIAAGIAVSVLSAGTMTPALALAVGTGFGLAQGAVGVAGAYGELTRAKDNQLVGVGSDVTAAAKQNDVIGAWGGLAVNVATLGLASRGAAATSVLMGGVALTSAGAVGGGLATALNPNVWNHEGTLGYILAGVAEGAVGALAGFGLGHMVQVGVARAPTGEPQVTVVRQNSQKPIPCTVARQTGSVLSLQTVEGEFLTVHVKGMYKLGAGQAGSGPRPAGRLRVGAGAATTDSLARSADGLVREVKWGWRARHDKFEAWRQSYATWLRSQRPGQKVDLKGMPLPPHGIDHDLSAYLTWAKDHTSYLAGELKIQPRLPESNPYYPLAREWTRKVRAGNASNPPPPIPGAQGVSFARPRLAGDRPSTGHIPAARVTPQAVVGLVQQGNPERVHYIQRMPYSCGPTSMRMIIKQLTGLDVQESLMRKIAHATEKGYDVLGGVEEETSVGVLRTHFGLNVKPGHGSKSLIQSLRQIASDTSDTAVMTNLKMPGGGNHYVVLDGIKNGMVKVRDPMGTLKPEISVDELIRMVDGLRQTQHYLIVDTGGVTPAQAATRALGLLTKFAETSSS